MDSTSSIFKLVSPERVRAIVLSFAGPKLAAQGLDEDEYVQEVYARLLRADRSERSRYNPARGRSPASYVYMVGNSMLRVYMESALRRRGRFIPVDPFKVRGEQAKRIEDITPEVVERVLEPLDLEEEREAALLLAQGCTVKELSQRLRLKPGDASEIRERVRALLLPVKEEIGEAV